MASVNKVILVGNLGADPDVRTFSNGGKVCKFSVATTEKWKDRQTGESRERTEWHRVAIYNENLVRIAENYLRKGRPVYLEGQLETRKWTDQSGNDRYTTEVVLRPYRGELVLLGSRDEQSYSQQQPQVATDGGHSSPPPVDDLPDESDLDDNIPF